MSNYSLNLRNDLNRRLTVNELDNNFLYLQELAISGTTSNTRTTNGYRGFYTGINRLFGTDATVTQIFISKNPNASYKNETNNNNDNEDFYVTGLSGSDTVVILNIYGIDDRKPLKVKDIRKFFEKFVDIVLHTNNTLNTELTVIRDSFYDNIGILTSSLPIGSLYKNFVFQDRNIEYSNVPYETSGTGSGTFSFYKSDYGGYSIYGSEGGPEPGYNTNFTHGFLVDDIVTISGTALGGQSPENDATMYVTDTFNGAISTFEIKDAGTGYTDGFYYLSGSWAQFYITTASGSVTDATLLWPGAGYTIDLSEGYAIYGGNNDATILVTGVRNGVIDGYNLDGKADHRSPYRNSENPWPVMKISDGGGDQYDGGNWITTDKSITKVIGSIQPIQIGNQTDYVLTVTEVISGTISVGQSIRHNDSNYEIFTGTTNGGVGTYSVGGFTDNDISEQIFTIYGINYGGGEVVENNTFGTGSSYITLYDESIFAMVAINTDIDKVWYRGDFGSDNNKEVNVIGDNNTLSLGETKVELSNKYLMLSENDTLGWMSVLGPLHNFNDDIVLTSNVMDDDENTYAVGHNNNDLPHVVKFNRDGELVWSFEIDSNASDGFGHANSIKIDPLNGQLVVLCEFNPDYTESLIVRIDPDGYVIRSNRLKDLNGLDEQGDIYLYDMTFNSDNELIIVGEKTTDYLEWIIGTSSVLTGSTVSTLVISPSSINNDIPQSTFGWSIAGTGIIGDEPLTNINNFNGVTGSLTPGGSSASFTILADYDNATYTILAVDTPGSGYSVDVLKPIVVPGTSLGGVTPDNDATIIQTETSNGGILAANITGTVASGSGTQSFSGVTGSTIEGSGATFDIQKDKFNGQYFANISNSGFDYVINDIITIPGSVFGGTSSNNCIISPSNLGGSGEIQAISISGTGSTSSLHLSIQTNVDFSASGTWSIYKTLNGEAYIFTENWEKTLIGDNLTDESFNSVITDSNNNIYCIGTNGGDNNYDKAIISKFNQNGDLQWTNILNEREYDCYGKSVAILGTNSVVTTHRSDYDNEAIISKITLDGELLWQKRIDNDAQNSMLVTDDADIYVAVDDDDSNIFPETSIRLFKLNSDGVLIWNNYIGGRYDFHPKNISIKNEKISIVGRTDVMANDGNTNGFVINLPTDGTLSLGEGGGDLIGITNYRKGDYVIQSVTSSFYESINPQVGTHSITYTADNDLYDNNYDLDNNIDKIIEESGIIFGDGTKQTSSAGVLPQIYIPSTNDYNLKLSDIGKHIYRDTTNNSDLFIPTSEDVPFPIGTVFTIVSGYNQVRFKTYNNNVEIWGSNFNDNKNSQNGAYYYIGDNTMATLLKIGTNKWMVTSNNLSYWD